MFSRFAVIVQMVISRQIDLEVIVQMVISRQIDLEDQDQGHRQLGYSLMLL